MADSGEQWTIRLADEVELRNAVIEGPLNPLLDGGCEVVTASRLEEAEAERDRWRDRQEQTSYVQQCVSDRLARTEGLLAEALEALREIAALSVTSGQHGEKARRALSRAEREPE